VVFLACVVNRLSLCPAAGVYEPCHNRRCQSTKYTRETKEFASPATCTRGPVNHRVTATAASCFLALRWPPVSEKWLVKSTERDTVLQRLIGNESVPIQLAQCRCPGWPFPMLKYKQIFKVKYTEATLSNSTGKLLWFEITKMLIAV